MSDVLVFVLELIGTVAFAVSGAIVGIKKQMDLFGVIVLGICTAVGGGIVRDLILGVTPPVTFQNPVYTLTAAAVSVLMFLPHMRARIGRHEPVFDRLLLVMDAVGLGVFTVVGVQCAYQQSEDYTLFLLIFVGLITGVGGGVLRDVFSGERPYIFVRHFYACASIVGALICALCWRALGGNAAMLFGAAVVVVLRLLAAYYHWNLPAPTTTNPERKLPPIEFFRSKSIAPCCDAARGDFLVNSPAIRPGGSPSGHPGRALPRSRRLSSSSRFRQRIASSTSFTLRPQTTASMIPMISSLFIAQRSFSFYAYRADPLLLDRCQIIGSAVIEFDLIGFSHIRRSCLRNILKGVIIYRKGHSAAVPFFFHQLWIAASAKAGNLCCHSSILLGIVIIDLREIQRIILEVFRKD
ncbi:MAG: trimeric intracellular cation channel family protein [Oscillospiraceae bacterium]